MTAQPNTVGQLHPTARSTAQGALRDSYSTSVPPIAGFHPVDLSRSEEMTDLSFPTANPPFPRSDLAQAMIDVAAVLFAFLFLSVTALAIAGSVFIAFFVNL